MRKPWSCGIVLVVINLYKCLDNDLQMSVEPYKHPVGSFLRQCSRLKFCGLYKWASTDKSFNEKRRSVKGFIFGINIRLSAVKKSLKVDSFGVLSNQAQRHHRRS